MPPWTPRSSPPIPAHWNIGVSALLEVLAPIVTAEQAYAQARDATAYSIGPFGDDDEPDFPELDIPVYLLGARWWTRSGRR